MEQALAAWEKVALASLQRELDSQGLAIVENQNLAVASRKRLADQTKAYFARKYPEIDSITRRSKFAETSFLTLYKQLSDLPDPSSIIATALEQSKQLAEMSMLQSENRRLQEELNATNAQLAASKNSETSINSLKSRLSKYEAMLDEMVAERVAQKEEEMKQIMDDKIKIYKETEYMLNRQLSQLRDQFVNLQSNHDVTQAKLVDDTQKFDESVAARLAELDIVVMDLERSNIKVAQLSRENRLLKEQINAPVDETETERRIQRHRIHEVESENTAIVEKLETAITSHRTIEASLSQRVTELERQVAMKSFEVAELELKVSEYSDYEELKKELDVIKVCIPFNTQWCTLPQSPI
eukprot:jgi/Hompol1/979/HPOL_001179-RA